MGPQQSASHPASPPPAPTPFTTSPLPRTIPLPPSTTTTTTTTSSSTTTTTSSSPPSSSPQTPLHRPRLGFGTYLSPPALCSASCSAALACGYRHLDTAQYYGNEAEVGAAVRASGLPRADVFVTTKILQPSGSVDATLQRCRESVRRIDPRGGYVDAFLVHSPTCGREGRREMWAALERLLDEGGTRTIGVSNYGTAHLDEMQHYATVPPATNQVEVHPWCQQRGLAHYCRARGIQLEAYSPLARGRFFADPTLRAIARAHAVAPAQVLVRWSVQKGFVPLPKSDRPQRIRENADVWRFALDEDEMRSLDAMDRGCEGAVVPQVTECE